MLTSKQYHDLLKAKLRRFSRSQEEWKRFLETSSRMYKYGFKDSVSIFAQKPNATACAEIKTWKKATNRRVIRTSEAIGLVYSTDNVNVTSIRYVFDIANTVKINEQSKTPYFWQIDDTCEERVYNELKQAYGVTDAINFEEAVKKIVRERITYLTKDVQNNIIKSVEGSAAIFSKTADDLELNVPEAVFENIAAEPSNTQKELMKGLSERATKIHDKLVDPTVDNMLKVTSDGRKIGLDQRLMNPLLPDEDNSKVNLCVDKVYDIWQNTAEDRLTQLIFCDFSTPKNDGSFNLYDDVRDKLIAKGVPKEEIAYIHDYNTDVKKQTLFAKVRKGDVRVLLGSTAKCGAGTNVQNKLIALHHLDCPWRPADLEQREGRIIRQGNQNDKVYIYRYVTKDTFDAYLYQIIENKQKGISQIMTSKTPVRNCEDVDEAVLNYSEVKALCTGNPLIKERMELDIDISKLKRLQSAYLSEKYSLEDKLLKIYPQRKADAEKYIANTAIDAESYKQYSEEFTEMTINGATFTDKKEAANALLHTIRTVGSTDLSKIGTYKGFNMKVSFGGAYSVYYVTMVGKARYTWQVGQDPLGNLTRMENTLKSIGYVHEKAVHDLEVINRDIATAEEFVHSPWAREKELSEKSARLREVDRLIAEAEKNGQPNGQNKDIEEEQEMKNLEHSEDEIEL